MFLLLLFVLYGSSGYAMEREIPLITADNFSLTVENHYEHATGYAYALGWKERTELHISIDNHKYLVENGNIKSLQIAMVDVGKETHPTNTAHITMQIDTSRSDACLYKMIINQDNYTKLNNLLLQYKKKKEPSTYSA